MIRSGMIKGVIGLVVMGALIFVFSTKNTDDLVETKDPIVEKAVAVETDRINRKAYYRALEKSELSAIKEADKKYNYTTQSVEHTKEVTRLEEIARKSLQEEYSISNGEHQDIIYDGAMGDI